MNEELSDEDDSPIDQKNNDDTTDVRNILPPISSPTSTTSPSPFRDIFEEDPELERLIKKMKKYDKMLQLSTKKEKEVGLRLLLGLAYIWYTGYPFIHILSYIYISVFQPVGKLLQESVAYFEGVMRPDLEITLSTTKPRIAKLVGEVQALYIKCLLRIVILYSVYIVLQFDCPLWNT